MSWLVRQALVPVRYAFSLLVTTRYLLRKRPTVVVATNPPIFPALVAYALRPLIGNELILDSHPRSFGLKDSRVGRMLTPAHRRLVRAARATLVPSTELSELVTRWGGRPLIVHEAPPQWSINTPARRGDRIKVLWVAIFASDEPVEVVLEAARQLPDVDISITGDLRRCPPQRRVDATGNVEFTGFWPAEAFPVLIERSDLMLVLTTEPGSVPRAAFEAVEALRPLVISDWPSLRELFADAVFVSNTGDAIARGIREAIDRREELEAAASSARDVQRARWQQQRQELLALLEASHRRR